MPATGTTEAPRAYWLNEKFVAPDEQPTVGRCAFCPARWSGTAAEVCAAQKKHLPCPERPSQTAKNCARCGSEYEPEGTSRKYCSYECKEEAALEQKRESSKRHNERRREQNAALGKATKRVFTPEEDAAILAQDEPSRVLAERFGRSEAAIHRRRRLIRLKAEEA